VKPQIATEVHEAESSTAGASSKQQPASAVVQDTAIPAEAAIASPPRLESLEDLKPRSLWDQAFEKLDPDLVEAYSGFLEEMDCPIIKTNESTHEMKFYFASYRISTRISAALFMHKSSISRFSFILQHQFHIVRSEWVMIRF
jgi:hypothetical protein